MSSVGTGVRVPLSACLECGYAVDAASCIGKDATPKPGGITLCMACGHVMAFGDDLRLRSLTDAEMLAAAGNRTLLAVQAARHQVMKNRKEQ
jgi:hypothetical protein